MAGDSLRFNFQVDKPSLLLIVQAVDFYLEKWPGGHPEEQMALKEIKYELHRAVFEMTYTSDDEP